MLIMYSRFYNNCLQIFPRSESGGSVGKLKLSSEMKERFEAAVTGGGGGGSRRDSMKSSNEEEVGKLGEDRKKILEQKLRGAGSSGAGAGESKETLFHHRARLNCRSQVARMLQASSGRSSKHQEEQNLPNLGTVIKFIRALYMDQSCLVTVVTNAIGA